MIKTLSFFHEIWMNIQKKTHYFECEQMAIRVLSHSNAKTCKHVKNMEFLDFEMENGTLREVG